MEHYREPEDSPLEAKKIASDAKKWELDAKENRSRTALDGARATLPDRDKYPNRWAHCDGGFVYKSGGSKCHSVSQPESPDQEAQKEESSSAEEEVDG